MCIHIMDGQLYLIEILIEKISFTSSSPPNNQKISVKVSFGNVFNLEINNDEEEDQTSTTKSHHDGKIINFNAGKSCLFPCSKTNLSKTLENNPLEIIVENHEEIIAHCKIPWPNDFVNLNNPTTCTNQSIGLFKEGLEIGEITSCVRLYCFGKSIQTQFQVAHTHNKEKGDETPLQFKCQSAMDQLDKILGEHREALDPVPLRLKGGGQVLRLRGGGQLTSDDLAAGTKSPFVECQVVMEQFDKILSEYKKALGPCGQPTCPFSPNVTEDICKKVCKEQQQVQQQQSHSNGSQLSCADVSCPFVPNVNMNNDQAPCPSEKVAACGLPSCPLSRQITNKTEENMNDRQYKSACGSPTCPYSKYKTGLIDDDANMELQFLPSAVSGKCGHAKCPYPLTPELPPIHWDCPDPLPNGPCKNPNCPYLPPDLKALQVLTPKGICGSPNCPYALPNPCNSPTCPLKPQPCPYIASKAAEAKAAAHAAKQYDSCEEVNCPFAPQDNTNKSCGNPNCPYKNPPPSRNSNNNNNKECDNPKCPMKPPAFEQPLISSLSICNDPTCPYLQPLPSCGIPNCPYGSPPPLPPCGVRNCPYFPECPFPPIGGDSGPPQEMQQQEEAPPRMRQNEPPDQPIDYNVTQYYSDERIVGYDSQPCSQGSCYTSGGQLTCSNCKKDTTCPCTAHSNLLQNLLDEKGFHEKDKDMEKKFRAVSEHMTAVVGSSVAVKNSKKRKSETDARTEKPSKVKSTSDATKAVRTPQQTQQVQQGKKKKKRKSKYVYSMGDNYPGVQIGHRECVMPGLNVPHKMGWLWNVYTPCMRLKRRRGWRPGAIGRTIAERIRQHRLAKGIPMQMGPDFGTGKKRKRNAYGYAMSDSDESVAPKPTLQIKKKEGCYYITMNPLKDPKTLEDNENPYMDCTPMQFKITKNKEKTKKNDYELDDEYRTCYCEEDIKSSSSDSELDIEFTPPAGIIRPERLKKKINVIHCDTQYDASDFAQDKGKKGKDKGKGKDKKGGKGGKKGKGKKK